MYIGHRHKATRIKMIACIFGVTATRNPKKGVFWRKKKVLEDYLIYFS